MMSLESILLEFFLPDFFSYVLIGVIPLEADVIASAGQACLFSRSHDSVLLRVYLSRGTCTSVELPMVTTYFAQGKEVPFPGEIDSSCSAWALFGFTESWWEPE